MQNFIKLILTLKLISEERITLLLIRENNIEETNTFFL